MVDRALLKELGDVALDDWLSASAGTKKELNKVVYSQ